MYTNGQETFPLTVDTRTVQLIGTNRNATAISSLGASKPAIVIRNSLGDNRIEGVTITSGGSGRGVEVSNATFRLSGCLITNCYNTLGAGLYTVSAHGLLVDNVFAGNDTPTASAPIYNNMGGAVSIDRGSLFFDRVAFSANRVRAQTGSGWTASGAGAGMNGGCHRFRNVLAARNTLSGYTRRGSAFYVDDGVVEIESATVVTNTEGVAIWWRTGTVAIVNAILWDNPIGDSAGAAGAIQASYSCATGLVSGVQGNLTNDPQFVSIVSNDYSLLKGSPCVNAGLTRTWMIAAVDLAGDPRLSDNVVDMGAYESEGSPPPGTLITIL